jgi:hypothetical protein
VSVWPFHPAVSLLDDVIQMLALSQPREAPQFSGYHRRALVEVDISRFKRIIGDGPRARNDRRRATEVAIAMTALYRMLALGRPEYVRLP